MPSSSDIEKEFDRLGFTYQQIYPRTGEPILDMLVREQMGILAESTVIPIMNSETYQGLQTDVEKKKFLGYLWKIIKTQSKLMAQGENYDNDEIRELFQKTKEYAKSKTDRDYIELMEKRYKQHSDSLKGVNQ